MKKITFILVLLFSITIAKTEAQSQTVVLKKDLKTKKIIQGTYYKTVDSLITKFENIWEYRNGKEVFKIKIKRVKTFFKKGGVYFDYLNATYCYNKDGDCSLNNDGMQISNVAFKEKLIANFMSFHFYDKKYKKHGEVRFSILDDDTAKWELYNKGMNISTPTKKYILEFSIPTNLQLTRIK